VAINETKSANEFFLLSLLLFSLPPPPMGAFKVSMLTGEGLYILFHQVTFILTGLATTLGCQWLFYHGAASKSDKNR
jgi:hypothetical protein